LKTNLADIGRQFDHAVPYINSLAIRSGGTQFDKPRNVKPQTGGCLEPLCFELQSRTFLSRIEGV
jgi:hypothetical protein